MRFPILLGLLGSLITNQITNHVQGQFIPPGPGIPVYAPLPADGFNFGLGSNFAVLALAAIAFGLSLQRPDITTTTTTTTTTSTTTPVPGCPLGYSLYSAFFERFCFRYESQNCLSFIGSRTSCARDGGDLLSVNVHNYNFFKDGAEQIQGPCDDDFWVGVSRTTPGSNYVTVRGEPISNNTILWDSNERQGGAGQACVLMGKDINYRLDNDDCTLALASICQIFI